MVTDTKEVAWALDVAQRHWPELPRGKALLRLVQAGAEQLEADDTEHRRAVESLTRVAGTFPQGHPDDLRAEWPA
jgi:hypothetical protein